MKASSKALKPRAKKASASLPAFERLLVDMSTRFIALPSDRVDSEILVAQKEVCESLGLDISSLWQMPPDNPNTVVSTHIYVPPDYNVPLLEMDAQDFFPWSMVLLARGETVVLSRMTDIPPEGARDLEIFRYYRLQSSICFPLSAGGGPMFGAVAFDTFRRQLTWSAELIEKLRAVAQIFAHALARKRADEALKQALRELEDRLRFGTLISEISARFVSLPADLINSEIEGARQRICELLDLDRSIVWEVSEEAPRSLRLSHVNGPSETPSPQKGMDRGDFFPWTTQKIMEGETVVISKMTDLPPEASRDRESFHLSGTKSVVSVPLSVGKGPVFGLMSFVLVREERSWSETDVRRFKLIAQVLANALARKRADQAMAKSEARYRHMFEEAIVGFYQISPEGNVLAANQALVDMLGYESLEADVPTIRDLGLQIWANSENRLHFLKRIEEQGSVRGYECEFKRKDGRKIWVSLTSRPVRGPDGRIAFHEGIAEDISERRRVDEALKKSERFLAEVARIGKVGGWEFNIDTGKLTWTAETCNIHEVDPAYEPTVEQGLSFYTPASRPIIEQAFRRASENGEPYHLELEIVTAKGHHRDVRTMGRADLVQRRVYGFIQDISERKQDEREMTLLRLERTHLSRVLTVNEMSTSLAHEINQPLGAILNNAEAAKILLSQARDKREDIPDILDDIIQDAKRAGDVIRKVRSAMKRGDVRLESLSVNALINEALAIVKNNLIINDVTLRLELAPDLKDISGDRVHLQQVLMNLVINAVEAMKDTPAKIVTVRSSLDGPDMVCVSISDSGPGIPEAGRGMLFEPFFTTKKEGLGLGLSICKSIIEDHGGRIWADNNPAGGATFSFSLKTWKKKRYRTKVQ
jgi:PAS domain S-box-containing protein